MSSSHSTPAKSSSKPRAKIQKSGSSSTPLFTPIMQDRQARNKDPYSGSDEDDSHTEGPDGRYDSYGHDSYANIQLRRDAAVKLDNPESVMMLAQSRNESIPATRHYLTKLMCGFITKEDLDAEAAAEKREKEAKAGAAAGAAEKEPAAASSKGQQKK